MTKRLRVRFYDDDTPYQYAIATSIQLVIPDDLNFFEAEKYIKEQLIKEIDGYVASECAHHFFKEK